MNARIRTGLLWAILLAQLVALILVVPARAASLLWTLTASPLTATTGVQRVFTLTATNEDPLAALDSSAEIGCVVVDVPGNFTVAGSEVTDSNAGDGWHVDSVVGNRVTVHTDSGGERLEFLDWVRFTVVATPFNTGSLSWNARAFRQTDCTGGATLLGIPPIVVVTGPAVTPTPTPTPRPTPSPTPRPTPTPTPSPTPTPILPLPSVSVPSLPPLPSLTPSSPSPSPGSSQHPASPPPLPDAGQPASTPRATASATDTRSASPRPTPGADAGQGGAPVDGSDVPAGPGSGSTDGDGGPSGQAGAPALTPAARIFPTDAATGEVGVEISGMDLFGGPIWAVPAATIAGPGLLVLLWLVLQAIGAAAWMPSVRRLRGEEPAEAGSA